MSKELPINTDKYGRDESGRFKEGNKGKPKGATNTTTRELREFITNFLNDKAYEIPHIWDSLDDKDKASLYLHLSRLVLPKASNEAPEQKEDRIFNIQFHDTKELTAEEARSRAKELDDEY